MSALAQRGPLLVGPILHGPVVDAPHPLHPPPAVHDDEIAREIGGLVGGKVGKQVRQFDVFAEAAQGHAHVRGLGLGPWWIQFFPRSLGGKEARCHGVEADAVLAPFDGEAARHRDDAGFGGCGGRGEGAAGECRGRGDAEHGTRTAGVYPAATASHGAIEGAVQHNAEHRVDGTRRQLVAARDEISCRVVAQDIERPLGPNAVQHRFDAGRVTDVTRHRGDVTAGGIPQFPRGRLQHIEPPAADDQSGPEFEITPCNATAQSGAAARDENTFATQQILSKHD